VATIGNVPAVLRNAIKSGRYKRVSSEIYWNLKKGAELYKRVLSAVAFLGADAPAVTNLRDLEALFSQSTGGEPGSFERVAIYTSNMTGDGKISSSSGSENSQERRADNMLTEAEGKRLQDENLRMSAAMDGMKQATMELKKNAAMEQVREYCEGQVKASRMHPSTRDSILRGIKERKYQFTEEGGYAIPFSDFAAIYDISAPAPQKRQASVPRQQFQKTALFGRTAPQVETDEYEEEDERIYTSDGGSNPGEVVDRMVKKYCVTNKVEYSEGVKAVLQSNPKLAKAYIESTPIVRSEAGVSAAAELESEG